MRYHHNPLFEVTELNDGLVLTDTDQRVAHHLDAAAAQIWRMADGREHAEVLSEIAKLSARSLDEATVVGDAALGQLVQIGALLTGADR